jgi:hypothetical protein
MAIPVKIFISHKKIDADAATAIQKSLERLGTRDRLTVFVSEHITGGTDWFKWIKESLAESNLLFLLYTDRTEDWDWCMYEAGLFTDLSGSDTRKVVCIQSTDDRPEPLKHLQAVKAQSDDLIPFLEELYLKTELLNLDQPLSPWLKDRRDEFEQEAAKIANALMRRKVETHRFGLHMFIHVSNPVDIVENKIPSNALVTSDQSFVWSLFDKEPGSWHWGDLETEARKNKDQMWLSELARAIFRAKQKKKVKQIQASFRSLAENKSYRPVLYRADTLADGSIRFKVLFYEDISWQFMNVPDSIETLVTALVMATRFRYEVLRPYLERLKILIDPGAIAQTCQEAIDQIGIIEQESENRGLLNESRLLAVFDNESDRETILDMYRDWYVIRSELFADIDGQQCDNVPRHLQLLSELNRRFLDIGTRRLHELNKIDPQPMLDQTVEYVSSPVLPAASAAN